MKSKNNILLRSNIEKNKQNEFIFYRLIFVGDSGVGKTQLINVYTKRLFQNEHFPTFSTVFQIKTLNVNGKKINIHCIDTEGSADFSKDTGKLFVKKADAFILVYDITRKQTFKNIYQYYNIFKFVFSDLEDRYSKKLLYLIGNKLDLKANREVGEKEGKESANSYDAKFMELSAKTGLNVDRLFEYILQDIIKREDNSSYYSEGKIKNNSIYKNINSLRSNDSLGITNRNDIENESRRNYETSNYFLKTTNYYNTNSNYINNINSYQVYRNNVELKKSLYYYQANNQSKSKCLIF